MAGLVEESGPCRGGGGHRPCGGIVLSVAGLLEWGSYSDGEKKGDWAERTRPCWWLAGLEFTPADWGTQGFCLRGVKSAVRGRGGSQDRVGGGGCLLCLG